MGEFDGVPRVSGREPNPGEKTVCVVRYGGFGDQIQAANILPALKREGYHVTFNTTPLGKNVLLNDPHIDAWAIQDQDEVPNSKIVPYWKDLAKRFDRFINLSESIEGTLIAFPGRANYFWPDSVRRKRLGINYLEWTAELAEVPYESAARFYPSDQERFAARAMLKNERWNVVWALAGSWRHKYYPGQDKVIAAVIERMPDAHIYLVGDESCRILEAGWEEAASHVTCLSGKLDIRGTLALARAADCVIGPETGVLNAVAFEPDVAKVILLSHSSHENLTKHWVNTAVIEPVHASCFPCHRLHHTTEYCPEDQATGAAICSAGTNPEVVIDALFWARMRQGGRYRDITVRRAMAI